MLGLYENVLGIDRRGFHERDFVKCVIAHGHLKMSLLLHLC